MSNNTDETAGRSTSRLGRRTFLQRASAGAAVAVTAGTVGLPAFESEALAQGGESALKAGGLAAANRRKASYEARMKAATMAKTRPLIEHPDNGDELSLPSLIGTYGKGLPHNDLGEVDPAAFATMYTALRTKNPDDFEQITLGHGRKLTSPQAGLAFDLQGSDSHHLTMRPAPTFSSAEEAGEMAELYWMALARDVNFDDYGSDPLIARAAADLSAFSDFHGPKEGGSVTPGTIFRGPTAGELTGPFLSQFLLQDVPFGANTISQRMRTVMPGVDYLTDYESWLEVQRGRVDTGPNEFDPTPRYMRNLRDLAQWVHVDALYQAYVHACLLLLGMNAPVDPGLPSVNSRTQDGFAEFGGPHILSLVTEVATRALKAVWYQKWFVHRRLRPEEFGGRVHNHKRRAASYPIHPEILNSPVLDEVRARYGTYLLPQAFPEGSPTHPSYGSGHATVAGACVTILKAFFDESFILPNPVVASPDGTALVPYEGPALTVGGELNKVAANIGNGRNAAGVHWRTDFTEAAKLGEEVAICILEEQKDCHNQAFTWTLTTFDGTTRRI